MATVIIREYADFKRTPQGTYDGELLGPWLVTDYLDLPIKTVSVSVGANASSDALTPQTHYVEIESDGDVRVCVRPKDGTHNADYATLTATANHPLIKANVVTRIAVYPGAIINFRGVS